MTSTITAPQIFTKYFVINNLAITALSGGGAYYHGADIDIAVDGYRPIAVTLGANWTYVKAVPMPYIYPTTSKVGFISDISQTITAIDFYVTYIKE